MYEPIQPMRFVEQMKQPDAIAMLGCHNIFNNATLVIQNAGNNVDMLNGTITQATYTQEN